MRKVKTILLVLSSLISSVAVVSCSSDKTAPFVKVAEPQEKIDAVISFNNLSSYSNSCSVMTPNKNSGRYTLTYSIPKTQYPIEINEDSSSSFVGWSTSKNSNEIFKTISKDNIDSKKQVELFPLVTSSFKVVIVKPEDENKSYNAKGYVGRELLDSSTIVEDENGNNQLTIAYLNEKISKLYGNYEVEAIYGDIEKSKISQYVPCSFKGSNYFDDPNRKIYVSIKMKS